MKFTQPYAFISEDVNGSLNLVKWYTVFVSSYLMYLAPYSSLLDLY